MPSARAEKKKKRADPCGSHLNNSKGGGRRHNLKTANEIRADINCQIYNFQHITRSVGGI